MKNLKYIILIIAAILIIVLASIYIKPAGETNHDDHGHSHETAIVDEHDDHDDHGEKLIYLNQLQIENSDIDTGWFSMRNMSDVIQVNGHTKLPPQNQADVSVFSSGMIKSIKVVEGQTVKKGQVLAILESPDFTILQEKYLQSKSKLAYLNKEYNRQVALQTEAINALKKVEEIQSELDIEKARFNSLKRQLAMLKVNAESSTISTIPIVSPINGNITSVNVKIGSSVSPNSPLFSVIDNSEMHVDLMVYEKDLNKIDIGQKIRFRLTNQSEAEINGTVFNIGKSFENETKTVAVHAHIDDHDAHLIPGMYVNAFIDISTNMVQSLPNDAIVLAEGRSFIFIMEKENFVDDHGHEHGEDDHGHDHAAVKEDDHGHDHGNAQENDKISFSRVEVKTGTSQLGYTQVTLLENIHDGDKIVISGAYYIQSHLQKSESGGEHSH